MEIKKQVSFAFIRVYSRPFAVKKTGFFRVYPRLKTEITDAIPSPIDNLIERFWGG